MLKSHANFHFRSVCVHSRIRISKMGCQSKQIIQIIEWQVWLHPKSIASAILQAVEQTSD